MSESPYSVKSINIKIYDFVYNVVFDEIPYISRGDSPSMKIKVSALKGFSVIDPEAGESARKCKLLMDFMKKFHNLLNKPIDSDCQSIDID